MLLTDDFYTNPYPVYHTLRTAGPLHYSEEFFGGAWLLAGYDDVAWALKDTTFLSAKRTGGWLNDMGVDAQRTLAPFQQIFARAMLFLDAPDHLRLRRLMMAGFRPDTLQRQAPTIQTRINTLIDEVERSTLPDQPFDFMAAVARPLPAQVIADFMGLDPEAQDAFTTWSDQIAAFIGHPHPSFELGQQAQRGALAMGEYFRRLIPARRRRPGTDILSSLLQIDVKNSMEASAELIAQCVMLLFAGHETTRNLLGNGLHALLSTPTHWDDLKQNPDALLNLTLRELLRYDSPVQYTGRRVTTPFTRHGHTFHRGDLILPLIGAANRDPAIYTDPDVLRLDRREAPHLSFGLGAHVCIGAALTYLEADIALRTLLRRWPNLQLAPAALNLSTTRNRNAVYRGFERLFMIRSP
jgi:cytochrome P450